VDCTSPSLCRAISPNLSAGTVDVTVTTDGMTLNPETFTIAPYSPPLVRLVLNLDHSSCRWLTAMSSTSRPS
jgi:hypothetical protein